MARPRAQVLTLCLVQFVDVLGVTVVVSALPSMLSSLHAGPAAAAPVMTAYAVFFGGLLMLGARLGDRYGHRRVLLAGLAVFGAGSLVAATAGSTAALVAARSVQGMAAALSVPTALRLLSTGVTDEEDRRGGLSWWSASGAVAGASGLVLGGVVSQLAGWRAVFWGLLPATVLLALAVLRWVDRGYPGSRVGLDAGGGAALTLTVMALVLGCSLLQEHRWAAAAPALVVAGSLAAALFWLEGRATHPLLPSRALRHHQLATGTVASFANTATTSSAMTLATLSLQETQGESPSEAGLTLLPFSILVVLGAGILAPRLMRRSGLYAAAALGLVVVATGDVVLAAAGGSVAAVSSGVAVAGLGLGVAAVAATSIATDVPDDLAATAAGLLNTAAQLGTALGVALVVLVASSGAGPSAGWAVAAVAGLGGALLTWKRRYAVTGDETPPARRTDTGRTVGVRGADR